MIILVKLSEMKKTYHLCLSGGREVMFRDNEDYIRAINCLSLAAYKTESSLLAFVFMSNHLHICVRCEEPKNIVFAFRYPYVKYFNQKYGRKGRLGQKIYFKLEIYGTYHIITALSYILRNPLHHGVSATPFGYKYSSIHAVFSKELGREQIRTFLPMKLHYRYLPCRRKLPPDYQMNEEGMILPESVIDVADVQFQFSNPRTFLYYMNRLSGQQWEADQSKDNIDIPPITLKDIEMDASSQDITTMLKNENGRANYNALSDIELCYEIDKVILPKLKASSVYNLSQAKYEKVLTLLRKKHYIPEEQLMRCLPKPN